MDNWHELTPQLDAGELLSRCGQVAQAHGLTLCPDDPCQGTISPAALLAIAQTAIRMAETVRRSNHRHSQAEGIARARELGTQFGRPRRAIPDDFRSLLERWRKGELSAASICRTLDISRPLFYKWLRQLQEPLLYAHDDAK